MAIARQLEEYLWFKGSARDVWMIVDSACDRRIFGLLLECFYSSLSSLFAMPLPPQLESVAPYLVPLDYDDRKTQRFLAKAWGNNWAVFLGCDTSQERLRRHLRSFMSVRDPYGKRSLFRYYDPRILRTYLPTCTESELEYVFGPIECFWTESKNPDHLLEFAFEKGKLIQRTISVAAGVPLDAVTMPQPQIEAFSHGRSANSMLTIRQVQLRIFSDAEQQKFELWMLAHLKRFFPARCKCGDSRLQELIRYGIRRTATYGFTSGRDVCKYIDLMIAFGPDFDSDKRLPWAAKILGKRRDPQGKMCLLFSTALNHLR